MLVRLQTTRNRILNLGDLGTVQVRHGVSGAAAADWWDPDNGGLSVWAAYQPKGAASLAASYTDLSGNSHDAGVGTAPTWDNTNGWKFLAASLQYLTTTFVPNKDQSQSCIVQFSNVQGNNGKLLGCIEGSIYWGTSPNFSSATRYYNGRFAAGAGKLSGNLAVAGNQGYADGIAEGSPISPIGVSTALTTTIGAWRGTTGPTCYSTAYIQALAIYDTAITAAQVLAIATAMAAL